MWGQLDIGRQGLGCMHIGCTLHIVIIKSMKCDILGSGLEPPQLGGESHVYTQV